MRGIADRTPQEQANVLCGLLLIDDLRRKGLVEGGDGFRVETDAVNASLALLVVESAVKEPEQSIMASAAIGLMRARGIERDDECVFYFLLMTRAKVEWPG